LGSSGGWLAALATQAYSSSMAGDRLEQSGLKRAWIVASAALALGWLIFFRGRRPADLRPAFLLWLGAGHVLAMTHDHCGEEGPECVSSDDDSVKQAT